MLAVNNDEVASLCQRKVLVICLADLMVMCLAITMIHYVLTTLVDSETIVLKVQLEKCESGFRLHQDKQLNTQSDIVGQATKPRV